MDLHDSQVAICDSDAVGTHPDATDAGAATCARREGSAVSTTNSFTLVRDDPACDNITSRHHKPAIPQVEVQTESPVRGE